MTNVVLGERYVTGVAVEADRGVFAPAQDYARGRTPATIQTVVDKVDIQETEGSGLATKGQVTTMKRVQGEAPVNLRFRTYGYWLKSLFGGCLSAVEAGETAVYRHSFTVDPSALQPTLSISLTRGDFDHKAIAGAVVSQITENYSLDDVVNSTVSLMARSEATNADFTPAFSEDDHLAPHQFVTIKIADDTDGLAAAPSICVTSITNEMNRNTREKGCLSSETAQDFIARLFSLTGSFVWDKTADTYKSLAESNAEKAMQISIINTGIEIGEDSHPTLIYTFPRVNFTVNEERPGDDAVTETVNWVAHGVTASLVNEKANYDADSESA